MKRENSISLKFIGCTFIIITAISLISVQLDSDFISLFERKNSQNTSQFHVRSIGELADQYNPIYIEGNVQFSQMASQMNWEGDGTAEDPFIIKDLTLQGSDGQVMIEIRESSVHFVISNCFITGGETGVYLASVTNGKIENNTIRFSTNVGLRLEDVKDSQIKENNFSNCSTGIEVDQSTNNELWKNFLSNNSFFGIQFWYSYNNSIRENSVYRNRNGIRLYDSWNNNISQNIIYENKMVKYDDWWWWNEGDGIKLDNSYNNVIFNNHIQNNDEHGLDLEYSGNNSIIVNNISGNNVDGISLWRSEANTIRENQIENNHRGISLGRSLHNSIVNNTLINNGLVLSGEEIDTYEQAEVMNNTVNQKPLIWWQSVSEKTVPEAGEIILLDCSDLVITGQNITSASVGISTYFCSNISVYNNSISNNTDFGIRFFNIENCTISSNNITNNGQGIYTERFSGVKIVDNLIKNNLGRGIEVIHNDLEIFEFNGHEYALIDIWLPWREARVYCEKLGGHLVTIGSASENDFVENLADPIDDDVWIGLTDEANEGYWEWVTGEPLTYTNWEVNWQNGGDWENYVEMHRDGTWNDLPVTSSMTFVCEWETLQTAEIHSNISRNAIINNSNGIRLENVQNIQVNDNEIINNSFSGLEVDDSSASNITNNNLRNNGGGIKLWASSYNRITNNTLLGHGLIIDGWDSAHFVQLEITNNSVNWRPLIYWVNVSDKTISEAGQIFLINCLNISIKNQNLSYASGGIVGFNCTKIALTNNTVKYNSEFGVVFQRSSDCDITNNTISYNRHAIHIRDLDKFTITDNTITMNQDGGIIIEGREISLGEINTIKDNRVINSSRGIDLWDVLWVSIINNSIINNSESGIGIHNQDLRIKIYGDASINVTDNIVEHNGGGIELESVDGCILMNNTIIGHGFDIHRMEFHQFDQWIVQNNTVNGKPVVFWRDVTDRVVPETTGQVFLIRVQRINMTNLNIDSVANSICIIDSDTVEIQDCQFSNNSKVALNLQNTRVCNISGNYITQNNRGIELWNSPDAQFLGNIIHNNSGQGISVQDSSYAIIHNNSIMNHYDHGITVGGSFNCNLSNNIIANNNGHGIELWSSPYTQILGNLVYYNSWQGISVWDSSNTVIYNNSIMNHYDNGITLWSSQQAQIRGNIIHNNSGGGISVQDSSNTVIYNNSIMNHYSHGITVGDSLFCILNNNRIVNNIGNGIELEGGAAICTVEDNFIQNNTDGIVVFPGWKIIGIFSHSIVNNVITQNRGSGVYLGWDSENILLSDNTISENYNRGIWAEGVNNTRIVNNSISNNCVSNSLLGGIQLQWCYNNTIERNAISNNGIAFSFIAISNNKIISNSIVNNTYGCYLDLESIDNIIIYNDFIENFYLIREYNLTISQVFDNGTENTFIFNHYNDWVSPDDDQDGYVDRPYIINGSAQNNDPYPLIQPYPPLTRRIFGNKVLYPNGGETVNGIINIEWGNAIDSHNYRINYSIYFSENNGKTWNFLAEFNFLSIKTYLIWNTLECYDGSSYLIKVVAHASDGFTHEDISDSTFTVRNGNVKPPLPPPLAIRLLLFVILCSILIVFIKRGRVKAI
jgi:parallel beta-helix repeat protein